MFVVLLQLWVCTDCFDISTVLDCSWPGLAQYFRCLVDSRKATINSKQVDRKLPGTTNWCVLMTWINLPATLDRPVSCVAWWSVNLHSFGPKWVSMARNARTYQNCRLRMAHAKLHHQCGIDLIQDTKVLWEIQLDFRGQNGP